MGRYAGMSRDEAEIARHRYEAEAILTYTLHFQHPSEGWPMRVEFSEDFGGTLKFEALDWPDGIEGQPDAASRAAAERVRDLAIRDAAEWSELARKSPGGMGETAAYIDSWLRRRIGLSDDDLSEADWSTADD